ncbi:MAG: exodeoxyribonuclease VII large subunit, partial [Anaerolineales bacterium]|nr:exodeoxyribonuclease VII large subunit [Anaerolineales bacterium]
MEQLSFLGGVAAPLSVTDITQHIRLILENDTVLQDAWVQGEVSNASQPKSGHLYFTLKDAGAALRCVMWRNQVAQQVYMPKDGDAV